MNNFNDVENELLRGWNRAEMIANLHKDQGEAKAQEYADQFDDVSQKQIMLIMMAVNAHGRDEIQRKVMEEVEDASEDLQ